MFYAALIIVLDEEKRVLSLRRSGTSKSYPGKWGLPGGKGEVGEMPEDCAVRELEEETALLIKEEDLEFFHILTKGSKDFYCFIVNPGPSKFTLNDEHEELCWIPYKDLRRWLQIPTDDAFFSAMEAKIGKL